MRVESGKIVGPSTLSDSVINDSNSSQSEGDVLSASSAAFLVSNAPQNIKLWVSLSRLSNVLEPLEEVDLLSGLIGMVHRAVRLKGYIN